MTPAMSAATLADQWPEDASIACTSPAHISRRAVPRLTRGWALRAASGRRASTQPHRDYSWRRPAEEVRPVPGRRNAEVALRRLRPMAPEFFEAIHLRTSRGCRVDDGLRGSDQICRTTVLQGREAGMDDAFGRRTAKII